MCKGIIKRRCKICVCVYVAVCLSVLSTSLFIGLKGRRKASDVRLACLMLQQLSASLSATNTSLSSARDILQYIAKSRQFPRTIVALFYPSSPLSGLNSETDSSCSQPTSHCIGPLRKKKKKIRPS